MRFLPLLLLLVFVRPALGQTDAWAVLHDRTEARLRAVLDETPGLTGLVVEDLTDGERFAFRDDTVFPQGSSIKIPILMEVFRQAEDGRLALDDRLRVAADDQVGGSGVLGILGAGSVELSVRDLCVLMIVLSDNTATNMLIDLVGMDAVNATLEGLGFDDTRLQRAMMDEAARGRGDENLSTPAEAAGLMALLHRGDFLNPDVSGRILEILRLPKPGAVSASVPAPVPVAFKPGGIPGVSVEWAIVELEERPYLVVFMGSYGLGDAFDGAMREVSRIAYDYFSRKGRATRYGTYVNPSLIR